MLEVPLHFILLSLACAAALTAADPTFLRRSLGAIEPKPDDLTAAGSIAASYRPLFGKGDADARHLKGIARYGELTVGPGGASSTVSYAAEEQLYYVLAGSGTLLYGDEKAAIKPNDFMYLPPGVRHGVANSGTQPVRVMAMGYKMPSGTTVSPTPKPMIANAANVPLVPVAGHGPTSLFKLLMGTTQSTRDKLAAATQMTSLFIMDFAPGGTNIPHHHESEEEIYFVLRGKGEMVAGGGADGNEGRYAAKEGDAYFIRLNATVGFYSGSKDGEPHDLILAVRSRFPFPKTPR